MSKIIDRLYEAVSERGHVCLGLDTDISYLPDDFSARYSCVEERIFNFNKRIIDATLDAVSVYKVQIAYYEALGLEGLRAYAKTLGYIREKKALVIADVKRGDIAKTAEMYAKAHFSGDFEADFITVNPFMGIDTLSPFYPYLETGEKGMFVLVATSNPGACDIEGIEAADGESVSEKLAAMLIKEGERFVGDCGMSAIGAVIGCTHREQAARMRARMPGAFFLVPGYGAQGGTAQDMQEYIPGGNGGVVNSSRGILLARKKSEFAGLSFEDAARAETLRMRDDIRSVFGSEQ